MAFELRITFSGLCLFVPRPLAPGLEIGTMHVLMPRVEPHEHGIHRHVPVLSFDVAHLREGSANISAVRAAVRLRDFRLDVPDPIVGPAADLTLCPQIVDLWPVTKKPVAEEHVGPNPSSRRLFSRVTLGHGRIKAVSAGACWQWDPFQIRPIAFEARWEMPMGGTQLVLKRRGLGSSTELDLPALYPIADTLNLRIENVPMEALGPDPDDPHPPEPGFEPSDFGAYYRLFGDPVPVRLPKLWDRTGCATDPCPQIPPPLGGTPFTCMLAGVTNPQP